MKLENLKSGKFKNNELKREQMFRLNGGDTATVGGTYVSATHNGVTESFDYAYDAIRDGGVITYHGRTNVKRTIIIQE